MKTRLDVVLRLRDEAEKSSRALLGKAIDTLDIAKRHLEHAHEQAARVPPTGASSGAWLHDVFDRAHEGALARVKDAERALSTATADKDLAHAHHGATRTAQRVIARVVEEKHAELRRLADKREQSTLDELAILRA